MVTPSDLKTLKIFSQFWLTSQNTKKGQSPLPFLHNYFGHRNKLTL